MFNTEDTEKQYAFQLFDFAVEKDTLKRDTAYATECRAEFVNLVKERTASSNFWYKQYLELAKKVMELARLTDDFKDHGLDEAFKIIENKLHS